MSKITTLNRSEDLRNKTTSLGKTAYLRMRGLKRVTTILRNSKRFKRCLRLRLRLRWTTKRRCKSVKGWIWHQTWGSKTTTSCFRTWLIWNSTRQRIPLSTWPWWTTWGATPFQPKAPVLSAWLSRTTESTALECLTSRIKTFLASIWRLGENQGHTSKSKK